MKKLFVSAGLVAIGAAALESAMADDTGPKYWSVGATLRGFYDDNYNIANNGRGSAGVELSPTISTHVPLRQTDLGIRYTYGLYYYQDRQDAGVNPFDQTHQVDIWVDHRFNTQWEGKFTDTFALGQEPELLQGPNPVNPTPAPYRINGDNLANHGNFEIDTEWTRLFSTSFTYGNSFYDYDNHGGMVSSIPVPGLLPLPGTILSQPGTGAGWAQIKNSGGQISGSSLAGVLDRDEHNLAFNLKWTLDPNTTLTLGYEFDWYDYLGNEPIAVVNYASGYPLSLFPLGFQINNPRYFVYNSGDRDAMSHKIYLGVTEQLTPNIFGNISAGAEYNDPYADPVNPSGSWAPYASGSLSYAYLPGSYVQLGLDVDMSATDQVIPDSAGRITQYAQDTVVYLDVNHKITQKLTGTVIGRVQYSTYQFGAAANSDTTDYSLGVNLTYQFTPHFSMDAGYNYDDLVSDIAGYSYSRNRVYLGLTANY